jgi:hypothetical protein
MIVRFNSERIMFRIETISRNSRESPVSSLDRTADDYRYSSFYINILQTYSLWQKKLGCQIYLLHLQKNIKNNLNVKK